MWPKVAENRENFEFLVKISPRRDKSPWTFFYKMWLGERVSKLHSFGFKNVGL